MNSTWLPFAAMMVVGLKAIAPFWPTVTVWMLAEDEPVLDGAGAGIDELAMGSGAGPPYCARARGIKRRRRVLNGIILDLCCCRARIEDVYLGCLKMSSSVASIYIKVQLNKSSNIAKGQCKYQEVLDEQVFHTCYCGSLSLVLAL